MEKATMHSLDMVNENIKKIGSLFPECITETVGEDGKVKAAIDFEKLQENLSHATIGECEERYQFTWPGKREAIHNANAPTNMTLRPCKEESVDFDNTENLYIEGDNLEVLKLLQENYLGKIKMIYIDPPYNTGNDFVYNDDFKEDKESFKSRSGMYDEDGNMLLQNFEKNTESNGRFHTDWLNMMYPRLKIARNLLSDDGVIFISIGVEELTNLKAVCNEIFGTVNFVEIFSWVKTSTPPALSRKSRKTNEYILCYEKNKSAKKYNGDALDGGDQPLLNSGNGIRTLSFPCDKVRFSEKNFPNGNYSPFSGDRVNLLNAISIENGYATSDFELEGPFKWTQEFLQKEIDSGTTFVIKTKELSIRFIRNEEGYKRPTNFIKEKYTSPVIDKPNCGVGTNETASSDLNKMMDDLDVFSYPKPVSLIKYLINFITEEDDIVLDFFSGSSTTAEAVLRYNVENANKKLKFINVQLQENLDEMLKKVEPTSRTIVENAIKFCDKHNIKHLLTELGKERIRRAGKKIIDEFSGPSTGSGSLDIGFRVLKLAESNMKDVFYSPAETTDADIFDVDNVKEDRTPLDLLFQVMPECNLPLSSKIEERTIEGKTVYFVEGNYLVACFDSGITDSLIKTLIDVEDSQKPYYFYMRNLGLESDKVLDNFEQLFVHYSPTTKRKVI